MSMKNENPKPFSVKWWIALIIAVLTAIAGMLTEAKTSVTADALGMSAITTTK